VILAPVFDIFGKGFTGPAAMDRFYNLSKAYTLLPGIFYHLQVVIGDALLVCAPLFSVYG
jgi:hypothetical protein